MNRSRPNKPSRASRTAHGHGFLSDPLVHGVAVTICVVAVMGASGAIGAMLGRLEATAYPLERQAAQAVARFETCEPSVRGDVIADAVRSALVSRSTAPAQERIDRRMAYGEALAYERTRLALKIARLNCAQAREHVVRLIGH